MNTQKKLQNQTTWNLTHMFKNDNDPAIEVYKDKIAKSFKSFIKKWKDNPDYLAKPETLAQALNEFEKILQEYAGGGKLGYYFGLRTTIDQLDKELKAKENKIDEFLVKLENELEFFGNRISKIDPKIQNKFLSYKRLQPYKHFLESSFLSAKHLLSEPEEIIMNLKSNPAHSNWTSMISEFLSKEERTTLTESGKKEKKTFYELLSLISSTNKKVRDTAVVHVNEILAKHTDVAEHEMNSILQNKKINDELRKYPRPDSSRHLSDDIDTIVVDALIESVSSNYKIAHDFYKLKAKLLKADKLEYHERNVPIGNLDKKYTYDDAVKLIDKTLKNIDPEFNQIFHHFLENGLIDVFPKKGKRGSAFCAYHTLNTPTYILLNHTDKLTDVLTLAHELGHGINDELMKKKQNALNFGTPLSTAEVASTFVEDFVLATILEDADEELKLALMMNKLNDDISTIYRQIACYKFEQELHKNYREIGYLSKEKIGELFQKNMADYMGKYVKQPKDAQNWWVYWGHIRNFFYVYSYASGLLISKSLQNNLKNDKDFIVKIKEFLSAGESQSPKDIFLNLGIDISDKNFWNKGIEETKNLLAETEKLAKKLKKI